jgi:hypothetical protein
MAGEKQHDFTGEFGACMGCGRYVEECMEVPFCVPQPFETLSELLIVVAQFMDAVKPDLGPEWSEHDQAVRDAVSRQLRRALSQQPQN